MLTYSFSTREKVLIGFLGIALLVVLWYRFVYIAVQDQITAADSQIAAAQDTLTLYQARSANLRQMQTLVEEYEEKGVKPTFMPEYDNTKSLMAFLNGVMSTMKSYDMKFEEPTFSEEDKTVHRSGTISFDASTYEQAREAVQNIARGPYPCQVDALSVVEQKNASSNAGEGASTTFSTTLELTFFEAPTEGMLLAAEEAAAEGQDLTALTEWNK